jgi:hypothetical protein
MAFEGARLVGYLGWAHYDRADALAFARSLQPPPEDRAQGRDVVWVMTMAATFEAALDALVLHGRARHDGWRAMGLRHKRGGGVVVFDRMIRLRRSEAAALAAR